MKHAGWCRCRTNRKLLWWQTASSATQRRRGLVMRSCIGSTNNKIKSFFICWFHEKSVQKQELCSNCCVLIGWKFTAMPLGQEEGSLLGLLVLLLVLIYIYPYISLFFVFWSQYVFRSWRASGTACASSVTSLACHSVRGWPIRRPIRPRTTGHSDQLLSALSHCVKCCMLGAGASSAAGRLEWHHRPRYDQ